MAYLTAEEIRHHYPPSMRCEDVSKITGIEIHTVYECLQKGLFPFGYALKGEGDNARWRYVILTERFLVWYEGKDMLTYSNHSSAGDIDAA